MCVDNSFENFFTSDLFETEKLSLCISLIRRCGTFNTLKCTLVEEWIRVCAQKHEVQNPGTLTALVLFSIMWAFSSTVSKREQSEADWKHLTFSEHIPNGNSNLQLRVLEQLHSAEQNGIYGCLLFYFEPNSKLKKADMNARSFIQPLLFIVTVYHASLIVCKCKVYLSGLVC